MPPGTSIAMSVGFTQVGIMDLNRYDTTSLHGVWRVTRVHPYTSRKVKSVRWLDLEGAREIPQKTRIIRSRYRIKMREYWVTLDPEIRERAERMSKYVKDPVPNEGACDFLEKARRAKALRPARSGREMAR